MKKSIAAIVLAIPLIALGACDEEHSHDGTEHSHDHESEPHEHDDHDHAHDEGSDNHSHGGHEHEDDDLPPPAEPEPTP